jgi:hypothetical protein
MKNYLKEGQWRYEWSWPQQQTHLKSVAGEIDQSIGNGMWIKKSNVFKKTKTRAILGGLQRFGS